jgi:hypothetical protein
VYFATASGDQLQKREVVLKMYLLQSHVHMRSRIEMQKGRDRAEKERLNHQRIDSKKYSFLCQSLVAPFEFCFQHPTQTSSSPEQYLVFVFPKYKQTLREFMIEKHGTEEYPLHIQSIARQLVTYLNGKHFYFGVIYF